MKVGNTSAALIELVVPGNRAACDKSLRDEIKFLLKRKVSKYTCYCPQLIAGRSHAHRRVLDVGNQRIVTPRAIGELHGEEVGCHTVCTSPFLLLEEHAVITPIIARSLLLRIRTCQVYLKLRGLRNLEVKIRTHIQTIVGIAAHIVLMVVPNLCHIAFILEVEGHEILHILCTTGEIEVGVVG